MSYRTVEDDIFKKKFADSKELYEFLRKNLKNKDMYDGDDIDTLKRVNE
jgi:hypothetical protein